MTVDLVVEGGTVVTDGGRFPADIVVDEGKVLALRRDSSGVAADRRVNAEGMMVLPGLIDPHTHWGVFNLPDLEAFERQCTSESRASLAGGVTTVMHCAMDRGSYLSHLTAKDAIVRRSAGVDVVYYPALTTAEHLAEVPALAERGVTSFKLFLNGDAFFGLPEPLLYPALEAIRGVGGTPMVHCEWTPPALEHLLPRARALGHQGLQAWAEARPNFLETTAMERVFRVVEALGGPIYVVHVSTREGPPTGAAARRRGVEVYLETCPHYLALDYTRPSVQRWGKVKPPIRAPEDREALWAAVLSGTIDTIGTDHCTLMLRREKEGAGDIWSQQNGFAETETMLPILVTEGVRRRGLSWERLVELTSANAARIHRIPGKGSLRPGSDADLVLVDPRQETTISSERMHGACDFTLYDGWKVFGVPHQTFRAGELVFEQGRLPPARGGRVIPTLSGSLRGSTPVRAL
jgi:dihydroorotase-like cyclic amidohydrolase